MVTISGFTIIRNAVQYDYPLVESINSALDIVDEFIVILGDCSDNTEDLLLQIANPKVKIIKTQWNTEKYSHSGNVFAHQTDIALSHCTGDWCIYLQADEVLAAAGRAVIKEACNHYINNKKIEGFLLQYVHFFGDYQHYISSLHFAYPREIRVVRNHANIHSWVDAQSFRVIPNFDYQDYNQKDGTRKLNCVLLNAYVHHYGWARDPYRMVKKVDEQKGHHNAAEEKINTPYFDYGNIDLLPAFKGSHPPEMAQRIRDMNWSTLLKHQGPPSPFLAKQFRLKYRIVDFIENKILGGRLIAGFKNYTLVGKYGF